MCAFQSAIMSGSTDRLAALLCSDIRVTTDSGGKAVAARRALEGDEAIAVLGRAHSWWDGCVWTNTNIGGGRGAMLTKDDEPILAMTFDYSEGGEISDVFITRNPAKLARLDPVVIL